MYELKIAWRNLLSRPVQTLVTIVVVALAVALAVTVTHLNEGLQRGIIRASPIRLACWLSAPRGAANSWS